MASKLRKVSNNSELAIVIKQLKKKVENASSDRLWHLYRGINVLKYFHPIIQSRVWIDALPLSFCIEEYEFDNVIYVEVCFVDEHKYSFEESESVFLNWLESFDPQKTIYLFTFPDYMYREGMFLDYEVESQYNFPCYFTTDKVTATPISEGFREVPLLPEDARRVCASWKFGLGELTVHNLEKLWAADSTGVQVLNANDACVGHVLWNRGSIENFVVDSRYRRQGIGKALLSNITNRILELDCIPLLEAGNVLAKSLFEGLGYKTFSSGYSITMHRK